MAAKFSTERRVRPEADSTRGSWNTIKREPKKEGSYSGRLTLAFAATAVMTALMFVVVLGVVWEGQFKAYTRQNMQTIANSTASVISRTYAEQGSWTSDVISGAMMASSVSEDIGVQLVDSDGMVLFDTTTQDRSDAVRGSHEQPGEGSPMPREGDSVVSATIADAYGNKVGTLYIWALGSEAMLTRSDQAFRQSSYVAIGWAAAIAIALACVIGWFVSRSLTKPINRITKTASQIRNGDLTARSGVTGTDEIGRLGETFDDMASSLERDLKLEHRLTSDVAHELRTPLMAMLATVEAMEDQVLPADEEHLEVVASEVRRLSRLVDAMLKLSRLENGSTEVKAESTDVVYLVKSLVSAQHQLFHEKGLHLRFVDKTNRGECYAELDPDLIREAVVNLLSNAMRYTNEDGWVVASVAQDKQDVLISVQDTGIGIAKEDIPQTFSRFWRSDASRERASGGLGVGLSIVKEIVDRHNGTISVESELGRGTTFTLHIPMTHQKRTSKQAAQA